MEVYNPEEFINALRRYCKGSDNDEGLVTKIVNVFTSFNLMYSANLPYSAVVEYARLKVERDEDSYWTTTSTS